MASMDSNFDTSDMYSSAMNELPDFMHKYSAASLSRGGLSSAGDYGQMGSSLEGLAGGHEMASSSGGLTTPLSRQSSQEASRSLLIEDVKPKVKCGQYVIILHLVR